LATEQAARAIKACGKFSACTRRTFYIEIRENCFAKAYISTAEAPPRQDPRIPLAARRKKGRHKLTP
jgi:hypothetical protein